MSAVFAGVVLLPTRVRHAHCCYCRTAPDEDDVFRLGEADIANPSFSLSASAIHSIQLTDSTTRQRRRLTRARSIISSPRPLRTALSMKRLKPFICSSVIVG